MALSMHVPRIVQPRIRKTSFAVLFDRKTQFAIRDAGNDSTSCSTG